MSSAEVKSAFRLDEGRLNLDVALPNLGTRAQRDLSDFTS